MDLKLTGKPPWWPGRPEVDQFAEALLRRMADADVRLVRGVPVLPVLPRQPSAPVLKVEDVDRHGWLRIVAAIHSHQPICDRS
jgi:hypothetical protein